MAHVEDFYVDPQGKYSIGTQTCVEELTGDYGPCIDDWCIERNHQWFAVTKILPDKSGEILIWWYDSESDAFNAAEALFA